MIWPVRMVSWSWLLEMKADFIKPQDNSMHYLEFNPDVDATIFYTSCTTGRPKGTIGTHRNTVIVAFAS
ncbi:AMP-binding protein [Mycobacterium decipiens]|uniref:AMP-dependent synthetase/ligase domain-containing protein n=1 Tax=Mycobacterium decipiens TaxID=1430326 RepID=A0A1X2LPY2_9MYCO|nr:AMP-binding protein [Mycobacterium decipiens]OSC38158.1 hypothetical protein B8W66_20695 [Mycobacterium decipiens]